MVDIRAVIESAVALINADNGRYNGQTLVLTDALGKPV
jgi:hypothetical protein